MILGATFEKFMDASPIGVMLHAVMENLFTPPKVNAVFHHVAVTQYQRELLFSTLVDWTSLVVCRVHPSVHAAYEKARQRIPVSVSALYAKLRHVEPATVRALVQTTAHTITDLIDRLGGGCQPLVSGYRVRIRDGNHLSGTAAFLCGLARRRARFITRQHGCMPLRLLGKRHPCGRCPSGRVYEQEAVVTDPDTRREVQVRRVTVLLERPTGDGDRELHLLTNLPPTKANAVRVATLYRKRWNGETAFQEMTVHLQCELNTLGYPRAALFAFGVAVCCYNQFAAVKGALRAVHGQEVLEQQLSNFAVVAEVRGVYRGMMIALPPTEWTVFQTVSLAELAGTLLDWASRVKLPNYRKQQRGAKKPRPRLPNAQFHHVSTAKLLAEKRLQVRSKPKKPVKANP